MQENNFTINCVLMIETLSIRLILVVNALTLYTNIVNKFSFWAYFGHFSHERPPPVSDHFAVNRGWSLMKELTVLVNCEVMLRKIENTCCTYMYHHLAFTSHQIDNIFIFVQ